MHKFWSWLGLNLGKHAGIVSVVLLVVTLVLAGGLSQLKFATGQDSYLNKSDVVYKDSVRYQQLFGGEAMVTMWAMSPGKRVEDFFTPANVAQMEKLQAQIKKEKDLIVGVVTPTTALQLSANLILDKADGTPATSPTESIAGAALLRASQVDPTAQGKAVRAKDAAVTLQRLSKIPEADRKLSNLEWRKFLLYDNQGKIRKALLSFFPDPTHTQMIVRLTGNMSIDGEGKASAYVLSLTKPLTWQNTRVNITTGAPVLLSNLNDYLRGGMLTLGAAAIAIMVVILLVLFDVRWRLLPLGVIVIGVIWAFGLAGYLGIPLTIVTIGGLPVMLGIGIDYAIQMHARVEEEVIVDRSVHPIQETSRNLGPALLVVTFDAIFAFAALRFAKVPMIRQFGLLLAVGIAAICLCSIIVPLAALGIREYKSPTKRRDFREGPLGRLVVWLGDLPVKWAPFLIVASLVIFVGGIVTEGQLTLQTDPVQWVNQSSKVVKDLRVLEKETGSSSELGVFVRSPNVFSNETVRFVHTFTAEYMAKYPHDLLTAASIESVMGFTIDVPGASDVSPTGAEVKAAFDVAPKDIQLSSAADVGPTGDYRAMNIVFRNGVSSLERRAVVVKNIRATVAPPNKTISATPSGLAVVGVGLLDNLEANRIILTYIAIAFVFLFLAVRLRSLVRALLSLVPVLIAVGAASLVAWALQLKLSPMTAVGGPLVVAACTEFTSLILLRFVEERRRGLSPKAAVDVTASRTGRAFIVSALTAIAGVAVISLSSLPLLRDFGRVVGMNVAVALLSALVVLPPMLAWADKRRWVTRGLVPDDILDAADRTEDAPSPDATQDA